MDLLPHLLLTGTRPNPDGLDDYGMVFFWIVFFLSYGVLWCIGRIAFGLIRLLWRRMFPRDATTQKGKSSWTYNHFFHAAMLSLLCFHSVALHATPAELRDPALWLGYLIGLSILGFGVWLAYRLVTGSRQGRKAQ